MQRFLNVPKNLLLYSQRRNAIRSVQTVGLKLREINTCLSSIRYHTVQDALHSYNQLFIAVLCHGMKKTTKTVNTEKAINPSRTGSLILVSLSPVIVNRGFANPRRCASGAQGIREVFAGAKKLQATFVFFREFGRVRGARTFGVGSRGCAIQKG